VTLVSPFRSVVDRQFGRGEPVRAQHERSGRLAGSGRHHLIHAGHAELAGSLVPLFARVSHGGIHIHSMKRDPEQIRFVAEFS
jgi:hypothetical protein